MYPRDFGQDLRRLLRDGKDLDSALSHIRAEGASIVASIRAVRAVRRCDLSDAKWLVHNSPAWLDVRDQNEKLQEELEQFAHEENRDQSAAMNSIIAIHPYKAEGLWVFDDEKVGLIQEPFVAGADDIIEQMVSGIENAEQGFTLLFSADPFPGHQAVFEVSVRLSA